MSLQNWLNNGWLTEHRTSSQEITALLGVADRDLTDCKTSGLSPDWQLNIPLLQKSKMLQIQGAKGEAVIIYCEPLSTLEMRHPRLSHWVNNMAVFTIFIMSLVVNSIKARKESGNADHYSH
ncbi:MAG: hypothetical protein WBB70_14170 [Desulfobacterales bacterium]